MFIIPQNILRNLLPKEYRKITFSKNEKENLIQQKIKLTKCSDPKIVTFEELLSSHEGKMLTSLISQKESNGTYYNIDNDTEEKSCLASLWQ